MAKPSTRKVTSPKVASQASKALRSSRTSPLTKTFAASALSQSRSRSSR